MDIGNSVSMLLGNMNTCFFIFVICASLLKVEARYRIVGGIEVGDRSYFAYQVSMRYEGNHLCGGSIIDELHILTASHCVVHEGRLLDAAKIEIVSGDLNIFKESNTTVKSKVSKIVSHPEYNAQNMHNDITIIKLQQPLVLTENVKPVVLATSTPSDGFECLVSGWGFTQEGGEKSATMRFVEIPIQNKEICKQSYPKMLSDGMLCAGFETGGHDACQYDSGGPMVCDGELSGIVSWGIGCAKNGYAGVYTDVSKYVNWIKSVTKEGQAENKTPRIVGGIDVTYREDFAYQVSIRMYNQHFCGGTIIDEKHVLTASHCVVSEDGTVTKPSSLTVVAGDLDLTSNTVSRGVANVFTHDDFDNVHIRNDIALLRISGKFPLTQKVKPIPLITFTPKEDAACRVSGWGVTKADSKTLSSRLKYTQVRILKKDVCNYQYGGRITNEMLCAGFWEGKHDACQGDSGGPLVCDDKLAGIVSWGFSCAVDGYPGIYTDVSKYNNWIKAQQQRSSANALVVNVNLFVLLISYILFI